MQVAEAIDVVQAQAWPTVVRPVVHSVSNSRAFPAERFHNLQLPEGVRALVWREFHVAFSDSRRFWTLGRHEAALVEASLPAVFRMQPSLREDDTVEFATAETPIHLTRVLGVTITSLAPPPLADRLRRWWRTDATLGEFFSALWPPAHDAIYHPRYRARCGLLRDDGTFDCLVELVVDGSSSAVTPLRPDSDYFSLFLSNTPAKLRAQCLGVVDKRTILARTSALAEVIQRCADSAGDSLKDAIKPCGTVDAIELVAIDTKIVDATVAELQKDYLNHKHHRLANFTVEISPIDPCASCVQDFTVGVLFANTGLAGNGCPLNAETAHLVMAALQSA